MGISQVRNFLQSFRKGWGGSCRCTGSATCCVWPQSMVNMRDQSSLSYRGCIVIQDWRCCQCTMRLRL
ncbi:hypothetical protein DPMN_127831 [Dreissena polymorpha]|uniref:Uncharacterized protein n=1 Tax=Dreissena polymorpha TaxID=45954 RepID=A0A9D4H2R2_DREPO|nr:hypothetical protein DPMN_127831 [Dreissena polymorpha]